jgi:hypothetical protein
MNTFQKVKIALEYLFQGRELEIKISKNIKHRVVLDNNKLKTILIKSCRNSKIISDLTCDISMNEFIELCEKGKVRP